MNSSDWRHQVIRGQYQHNIVGISSDEDMWYMLKIQGMFSMCWKRV